MSHYLIENNNPNLKFNTNNNNEQGRSLNSDTQQHRAYLEKISDNEYVFKIELLLGAYKPSDIRIKLLGNDLVVQAQRKFSIQEHKARKNLVSNSTESEFFEREVKLPDFIVLETLSCYLESYKDDDNVLIVEAALDKKFYDSLLEKQQKEILVQDKPHQNNTNRNTYSNNEPKSINRSTNGSCSNSNGYLKYKFDLKDYEADDINITIKNRTTLEIKAVREYKDNNGQISMNQFYHEIELPENIELFNIKNCFDERTGVLKLEIPLTKNVDKELKQKSISSEMIDAEINEINKRYLNKPYLDLKGEKSNDTATNDKYLELMFDLRDFTFDNLEVYNDESNKKILLVKASKYDKYTKEKKSYAKKYILPNWISSHNVNVTQEEKVLMNEIKNLLILQFEIEQ